MTELWKKLWAREKKKTCREEERGSSQLRLLEQLAFVHLQSPKQRLQNGTHQFASALQVNFTFVPTPNLLPEIAIRASNKPLPQIMSHTALFPKYNAYSFSAQYVPHGVPVCLKSRVPLQAEASRK